MRRYGGTWSGDLERRGERDCRDCNYWRRLHPRDGIVNADAWFCVPIRGHIARSATFPGPRASRCEIGCDALTRQKLSLVDRATHGAASGVAKGAYVLKDAPEGSNPEALIIATSSEVEIALKAKVVAAVLATGR